MKNFVQIIINDVYRPFTHSTEWNLNVICCLNKRVIRVFVSFVSFFFFFVVCRSDRIDETYANEKLRKENVFCFALVIFCIWLSFLECREKKLFKNKSLCCLGAKSQHSIQRGPKCWASKTFVDRQRHHTLHVRASIFFRLNELVRFWIRKVRKCKLILRYATHTRRAGWRAREC